MKSLTITALFCCLLYSAGAQSEKNYSRPEYYGNDTSYELPDGRTVIRYICHVYATLPPQYGYCWDTVPPLRGSKEKKNLQLDTIPVWQMTADTSFEPSRIIYTRLLEVRQKQANFIRHEDGTGVQIQTLVTEPWFKEWSWVHITYLRPDKTHLPKSRVVFVDGLGGGVAQDNPVGDPYKEVPQISLEKWDTAARITFDTAAAGHVLIVGNGDTIHWAPLDSTISSGITYKAGPGIMNMAPQEGYKAEIMLNWQWLPRRLRRRFFKYFHLK